MASVDVYSIAKIISLIPSWATLAGKPAVIAAGATQEEARTAIGAGTSNLALGTTESTAAAGNHNHDSRYYTETEVNSALALKAPLTQAVNFQTGTSYSLVASDKGKLVSCTNAAAITLTVPANIFSAGDKVNVAQRGAGAITVVGGSGMVLNPPPGLSLVTEGQYAYFTISFISGTVADIVGMMAAP